MAGRIVVFSFKERLDFVLISFSNPIEVIVGTNYSILVAPLVYVWSFFNIGNLLRQKKVLYAKLFIKFRY